ncbi:MAG: hypothetical protein EA398_04130 [Deltaproteobacteria bacterium]|nr:MAG: hypothetical protein EA398_04130 [Deltaproteobacteria bacterium]
MTALRAPGKAFLCGEYAVLDGAPALVTALDAGVRVTRLPGDRGRIHSDLDPEHPLDPEAMTDGTDPPHLTLPRAVLRTLDEAQAPRAPRTDLLLESRLTRRDTKLGLGSSGAACAALCCALVHPDVSDDTVVALSLAAHDRFQGTRGSGGDVLASLHGGLLAVRHREATPLPVRPTVRFLPTHISADTRHMIRELRRWRRRHPERWAPHAHLLDALAHDAVDHAIRRDVAALAETLDRYGRAEESLTEDSGVPITTPAVLARMGAARAAGWAAKPSGAGGGDLVVAMAPPGIPSERAEQDLHQALARDGFDVLHVRVAEHGALHERRAFHRRS